MFKLEKDLVWADKNLLLNSYLGISSLMLFNVFNFDEHFVWSNMDFILNEWTFNLSRFVFHNKKYYFYKHLACYLLYVTDAYLILNMMRNLCIHIN